MQTGTKSNENLKGLTQKCMTLVNQKEIVLPSTYRVVFSMLAKKEGVDIGAESIHTNEEISNEVYEHILSIDSNTDRAIRAIETRDDAELKRVLEDTKKLKSEVEALKRIAYEDGLTKALNRKWLEENYLEGESETFKKDGVIVMIDLNDFKQINDEMGHAVGDKVLMHLAARLKKLDADVVRYGGDEFVLLFDKGSPDDVRDVVHVLRELHLKKQYKVMDNVVQIKFAYGIAPFKRGESFSSVVHEADKMLYDDKAKVKERSA